MPEAGRRPGGVAGRQCPPDLRPQLHPVKIGRDTCLNPPRASHCETHPQKENLQDPPQLDAPHLPRRPQPSSPTVPCSPTLRCPGAVCPSCCLSLVLLPRNPISGHWHPRWFSFSGLTDCNLYIAVAHFLSISPLGSKLQFHPSLMPGPGTEQTLRR